MRQMTYEFFARWFGIISTLLSFGILFNLSDAKVMVKNMIKSETGYIMGGVLPIIFGSLAFMHHNAFEMNRQILVTIIGLAMILIGAYRVLFVEHWKHLMYRHADKLPALFSLFGLMFSVILLYVGFVAPIIR